MCYLSIPSGLYFEEKDGYLSHRCNFRHDYGQTLCHKDERFLAIYWFVTITEGDNSGHMTSVISTGDNGMVLKIEWR